MRASRFLRERIFQRFPWRWLPRRRLRVFGFVGVGRRNGLLVLFGTLLYGTHRQRFIVEQRVVFAFDGSPKVLGVLELAPRVEMRRPREHVGAERLE